MKLYLVDTVSSFRNSYVIRCEDESHAADSVTMGEPESEMSQQWLGEHISRIREITEEEYLELFEKDNEYLKGWTDEKKKEFIHTVDYDKLDSKSFNPIEDGKAEI
jgi:hypothetical protein